MESEKKAACLFHIRHLHRNHGCGIINVQVFAEDETVGTGTCEDRLVFQNAVGVRVGLEVERCNVEVVEPAESFAVHQGLKFTACAFLWENHIKEMPLRIHHAEVGRIGRGEMQGKGFAWAEGVLRHPHFSGCVAAWGCNRVGWLIGDVAQATGV